MILYTYPGSPVCRPIAMFIEDNGLEVEQRPVDLVGGEQFEPWFVTINPNRAVPVLEDGAFRLTEASAILKYLADRIDSPAYPKPLQDRARVNAAMDWVNTGFYRTFGYGLVYPQVLAHLRWPDPAVQAQMLAASREAARRNLDVLNDHVLGGRNAWLCGERLTIADYLASGVLSMGELTGCRFTDWPHVQHWYEAMQRLPHWASANAALYAWADAVRGPDYLRI